MTAPIEVDPVELVRLLTIENTYLEQSLRSSRATVRQLLEDKRKLENRLRKHSKMTKVRSWSPSWANGGDAARSYARTEWYGPRHSKHAWARAEELRSAGFEVEVLSAPLGSFEDAS